MTNNRPFHSQASYFGGAKDNTTCTTAQFDNCLNTGIQQRIGRYVDTTAGNTSGLFGSTTATIASATQLKNDFTPYYEVLATNYMVWYDYAVIRLSTLFESLSKIGLTRKAHSSFWNFNRYYWVNVERSNITDKLQPRNINISFTNNNNVPIDVLVFTFKSNQLTIDVETGITSIP
jgi:hypothetical protein